MPESMVDVYRERKLKESPCPLSSEAGCHLMASSSFVVFNLCWSYTCVDPWSPFM